MYNLGSLLTRSEDPDYAEIGNFYRQAAQQGHARAQIALGILYANGQGVTQDPSQAYLYLSLGVANTQTIGVTRLGCTRQTLPAVTHPAITRPAGGDGGLPAATIPAVTLPARTISSCSPRPAERLQTDISVNRPLEAMAALISRDQRRALDLQVNAMLGNAGAQHTLGTFHQEGDEIPQNNEHAYIWLTLATANTPTASDLNPSALVLRTFALRGDASAQHALGVLYQEGTAVPQNDELAYFWLKLADDNGYDDINSPTALSEATTAASDATRRTALNTLATTCRTGNYGAQCLADDVVGDLTTLASAPLATVTAALTAERITALNAENGEIATCRRTNYIDCATPEDLDALHARALAAATGDPDAMPAVAADPEAAVALYQQAADRGHAQSLYDLGVLYEAGTGVTGTEDERLAIAADLYRRAALQDHADALFALSRFYENGLGGVTMDPERATNLLEKATEGGSGNADAQYALALRYETGDGSITQDNARAVELLQTASTGDDTNADAQYNLAQRHLGICPPDTHPTCNIPAPSETVAIDLLERAARGPDSQLTDPYIAAGNTAAQYDLAVRYINGNGVTQSDSTALELIQLSSDKGYAPAQYALGFLYQNNRAIDDTDTDFDTEDERLAEAARLYQLAAAADHTNPAPNADAQYALGKLFEANEGIDDTDTDYDTAAERLAEAARLYELAACGGTACPTAGTYPETGNAAAQAALARFYTEPLGGLTTDKARALQLLDLAAKAGNADAQLALGIRYEEDDGITEPLNFVLPPKPGGGTRDINETLTDLAIQEGYWRLAEAAALYRLAYAQGNIEAARRLASLTERGIPTPANADRTTFNAPEPNPHQAAAIYRLAANNGDAQAAYALGQLYENGQIPVSRTVPVPTVTAIDPTTLARIPAERCCGLPDWTRDQRNAERVARARELTAAAQEAAHQAAIQAERNRQAAIYYTIAVRPPTPYAPAQYALGYLNEREAITPHTSGFTSHEQAAEQLYRMAEGQGHVAAAYRRARLLYARIQPEGAPGITGGIGGRPEIPAEGSNPAIPAIPPRPPAPAPDYGPIFTILQINSASHNHAPSQNFFGILYENDELPADTIATTVTTCSDPADPTTCTTTDKTTEEITAERYEQAARFYKLAADQGNTDAQYNLASLYARKLVPAPTSPAETREAAAFRLYTAAAAKGHAPAQIALGALYANGQGVTKDPSQAYLYLTLGTANSLARGLSCLGPSTSLDITGLPAEFRAIHAALPPDLPCSPAPGVADHDPLGPVIGRHPAAEGLAAAMAALISTGQKAALDTQVRAMQGNVESQFSLGRLHQNGTGIRASISRAYIWLKIAEQNGYIEPAATPTLTTVTGSLTANQKILLDLELAAAEGDATAAYDLGLRHQRGLNGLTADNTQAYLWYHRALAGYVNAAAAPAVLTNALAIVNLDLTADQRTRADLRLNAERGDAQAAYDLGIALKESAAGL
ncbi:MAG: sel1 repeat family protein, partial [Cellvibrionales bacterium]|nr:sel1 repeat family protein [Cellvibrionales bacterium]